MYTDPPLELGVNLWQAHTQGEVPATTKARYPVRNVCEYRRQVGGEIVISLTQGGPIDPRRLEQRHYLLSIVGRLCYGSIGSQMKPY